MHERAPRRIVILMIGDGMGNAHVDAASYFRHGSPGKLVLQTLPIHVEVETASASGMTDSAAAATAMSTGELVYNGQVGTDRDGNDVETVAELARRQGLAVGVVATSSLTDATPAAFISHASTRRSEDAIADAEVRLRPEVLLGGGRRYFERGTNDGTLVEILAHDGYDIVHSAQELAAAKGERVLGVFSDKHMMFQVRRLADTTEPSLSQMTLHALSRLDRDPEGFFLVVEGSLIDGASHENLLAEMIGEVLEFDNAVRAVLDWSSGRSDVTVIVTADHESGGLELRSGMPAGTLPDAVWHTKEHTTAAITLYARGPGPDVLPMKINHRWVHAVIRSRVTATPFKPPPLRE